MIITNVRVYQDKSDFKTNFRDAMPILQNSEYSVEWYGAGSKFTIRTGDQITILRVYSDEISPEFIEFRKHVLSEIKKFTLEVEYGDVYDQHIETLRRDKWET